MLKEVKAWIMGMQHIDAVRSEGFMLYIVFDVLCTGDMIPLKTTNNNIPSARDKQPSQSISPADLMQRCSCSASATALSLAISSARSDVWFGQSD